MMLKYGDSVFPFPGDLSDKAVTIKPRLPVVDENPEKVIERSLENPLSGEPLSRIVRGGERVAIAIPDITRYSASEIYLPIIMDKLKEGGVEEGDVSLFVALGIHRRLTRDELVNVTGGLSERVTTVQHDPDANLTFLGDTSRGTPVYVNTDLLSHDRIFATGTISFHYFAGFGGGRKVIVPGLAGRETCHASHFRVFKRDRGKHPMAKSGILAGNPVHEDVVEAALKVKVDSSLNTCLTPEKKVFGSFAGDLVESHDAACCHYGEYFKVELEKRLPLVIASAGGYPKDINFIQSHKALDNAFQCVSEGGAIILLAECSDGFGSSDFFTWFRFTDLDDFEDELRKNYVIYGQTAYSALYKAKRVRVILVSSLKPEDVLGMSMVPADSLGDGIEKAKEFIGSVDEFYLIPDGGYVLPQCGGEGEGKEEIDESEA